MTLSMKQKREIIVGALKSCNARIKAMAGDVNPQLVLMVAKNKGYQAALEDVLLLLDGQDQHIKCLISTD